MEIPQPIVVDSSVAVKWFYDEHDSDKAISLLDQFQAKNIQLCVVDFLIVEVLNALRYKPLANIDFLESAISVFSGLGLIQFPLSNELLLKSSEIAIRANISIYDAAPVALAQLIGAICITSDKKTQFNKLAPLNFPVKLLE